MQTLWSRVAQTRGSCRCPQCLLNANGITRRATASASRRMPKYLTSSTLWYSGIFAAAATFDASVKKERREQWDTAIEAVKQELGQPKSLVHENVLKESKQEQEQKTVKGSLIQHEAYGVIEADEDLLQYADPEFRKSQPSANTGPLLQPHNLPPQSIYAEDWLRRKLKHSLWTPKKLARVELSIEGLQLKILMLLQERGWSKEASADIPRDFRNNFFLSKSELQQHLDNKYDAFLKLVQNADPFLVDYHHPRSSIDLCHYEQDGKGDFNGITRELNARLHELFHSHAKGLISMPALLGNISYQLSASSAPPNINTYNTLLIGFSNVQPPMLVHAVIRSLRESMIRLNEVSLVAALNHYTNTNQRDKFVHWIELMRGKHGGLSLARKGIRITDAGRSRLIPMPNKPGFIIQLPYPTPDVFAAVIKGMVKFAGFETALSICQNMGKEGWGLCMAGLTPLLQDCAVRGDWTSGLAVWNQIQVLKATSRRRERSKWVSERIQLRTFAAMLRLCSTCNERDYFESIWTQALGAHRYCHEKLAELIKGSQGIAPASMASVNEDNLAELSSDAITATEPILATTSEVPATDVLVADEPGVRQSTEEHSLSASMARLELQSNSTKAWTASNKTRHKDRPREPYEDVKSPQRAEEQLHGTMPPNYDLDAYELRERPMTISG